MDTLTLGLDSLLIIVIIAWLSPYIASLIPGKPIPEAVFLVFAGALLGPHGIPLIDASLDSIQLLSQLGCAFLFLMAGYEIDTRKVTGPMGRHASLTWVVSLAIALAIVPFLPLGDTTDVGRWAFALAMTTTAFGTLAPIMRDRELDGTPVGDAVTVYGSIGEVLPVLAMGLLLSSGGRLASLISIVVYVLLCLFVLWRTKRAKAKGTRATRFIGANEGTGVQATVRVTILLLVFLVTMAHDMDLDIVVGAFAAGFILRALIPEGNHLLEGKLEAISFGFLVPLFFIVSGTTIELSAVGENPLLFIGFIGLLLLVRALPVFVSLRICPESRKLTTMQSFSSAMYCSMALPVIVAVTSVAVGLGAMTESMASVLVTGGAFTVLAVPLITAVTRQIEAAHPVQAVQEIAEGSPGGFNAVVEEHRKEYRNAVESFRDARLTAHEEGRRLSSTDYLAMRAHFDKQEAERRAKERETAGESGSPARRHLDGFDNPSELGLLRAVELWFALSTICIVMLFIYNFRIGTAISTPDILSLAVAAFNAISLYLIARRKKAAKPAIIALCAIGIVASAAVYGAMGSFTLVGQLFVDLPNLLIILYFATSRRVKAMLTEPMRHDGGSPASPPSS